MPPLLQTQHLQHIQSMLVEVSLVLCDVITNVTNDKNLSEMVTFSYCFFTPRVSLFSVEKNKLCSRCNIREFLN